MKLKLLVYLMIAVVFLAGCRDYPKDPHKTLEKVKGGTLRVGIAYGSSSNLQNGAATGPEADFIRKYAQNINAEIKWIPGSQEQLINLLKQYQIDIAIGGFTKGSVFKKHAAFTQPIFTERIKVGAPSPIVIPEEIEDMPVMAREGSEALVAVVKKEGKPIKYDSVPDIQDHLIAAPEDELRQMGLEISEYNLKKIEHVVAVPKGENGFLADLDKFIQEYVKSRKN